MASIYDVAKYFLELDHQHDGEGISNLKMQKLVYYAQGYYSAIFNKPLFDADISAWVHGPVVTDLYHEYKGYGKNPIEFDGISSSEKLLPDEIDLISEVFNVYGQFSAWALRDMTHGEPPWMKHEKNAGVIPLYDITDYFKTRLN